MARNAPSLGHAASNSDHTKSGISVKIHPESARCGNFHETGTFGRFRFDQTVKRTGLADFQEVATDSSGPSEKPGSSAIERGLIPAEADGPNDIDCDHTLARVKFDEGM
jgi:hypothetical protein